MPLKNQVKEYRETCNLSQTDLGKIVGVSRQTVSSIERGDYHPSVVVALKIAQLFEVPVEEVFQYEKDDEE